MSRSQVGRLSGRVAHRVLRMPHLSTGGGLPRRRGLTLMELVVVMAILVALASILVPIFPSMLERAHRSTQATNASELTKAIQLYLSTNGSLNGCDLLTDGTTVIDYLPAVSTTSTMLSGDNAGGVANYLGYTQARGGYVSAGKLSTNAFNALNGAGITNAYPLALEKSAAGTTTNGDTWQPTFNPYPDGVATKGPTTLTTSTEVVYVNGSGVLQAHLASPSILQEANANAKLTGQQFVMFGLGQYCSAVGTAMASAPYNFPNDAQHENPNQVYERFGLIFQVEDASGNALPAAVFLGAVAIESNFLLGTDKMEESYSQNIQQVTAPNAGPGE